METGKDSSGWQLVLKEATVREITDCNNCQEIWKWWQQLITEAQTFVLTELYDYTLAQNKSSYIAVQFGCTLHVNIPLLK